MITTRAVPALLPGHHRPVAQLSVTITNDFADPCVLTGNDRMDGRFPPRAPSEQMTPYRARYDHPRLPAHDEYSRAQHQHCRDHYRTPVLASCRWTSGRPTTSRCTCAAWSRCGTRRASIPADTSSKRTLVARVRCRLVRRGWRHVLYDPRGSPSGPTWPGAYPPASDHEPLAGKLFAFGNYCRNASYGIGIADVLFGCIPCQLARQCTRM